MEKVLQEFRIIETDEGFRIEITGDKEQLRDFVMSLDPRHWMHGAHGHESHGFEFPFPPFMGPRMWHRMRRHGFGPFPFGWDQDEEEEFDHPRRKRGRGRGRGRRRSHHEHHEHEDAPKHKHDEDEVV